MSDNIWNLWCEQSEVVIEWMDSFCRGEIKHKVLPLKEESKDESGEAEGPHLETRHAVLINIQTARNYTIDGVFSSHCLGDTKGKDLQAVS